MQGYRVSSSAVMVIVAPGDWDVSRGMEMCAGRSMGARGAGRDAQDHGKAAGEWWSERTEQQGAGMDELLILGCRL